MSTSNKWGSLWSLAGKSALLLTVVAGASEGVDQEVLTWLGDPAEQRGYRAAAIPALVFARTTVNAAVFEFAQSIPKDATPEAVKHLDEILAKRIWDEGDNGSSEVVSVLTDAFVRSAPNRSVFDLLKPKLGPSFVHEVFKRLGGELSESERASLLSALASANGSLDDRDQATWAYLINKRMSQKKVILSEEECVRLEGLDDFRLYIANIHRVSSGRDPVFGNFSKLWAKYREQEHFGGTVLGNDILMNPKMSPFIVAVGRDLLGGEWSPARESVLFGIINTVPVKSMSEDVVALIRDIVDRPIALPNAVELAGIDLKVSAVYYKLLSKQYGTIVLEQVGERK